MMSQEPNPTPSETESSHYLAPLYQEETRISGADTATYYQYELYDTTATSTYTSFWCEDSTLQVQPVLFRLNFFSNQAVGIRLPQHFSSLTPSSYAITGMIEVYVLEKGILIKDNYNFDEFVYLPAPKPVFRPIEMGGGFTLLTMPFNRDGVKCQVLLSLNEEERANIDYFLLGEGETEMYSIDAILLRFDEWASRFVSQSPPKPTRKT